MTDLNKDVKKNPVCWNSGCPDNCIYHHKVGDCPYIRVNESFLAFQERRRERRKLRSKHDIS